MPNRVRWRRSVLVAVALAMLLLVCERLLSILLPFPMHRIDALVAAADRSAVESVALEHLSPVLLQAVLCGEDERFHQHHGVDGLAVLRAVGENLDAGAPVHGAETISMQVVRWLMPPATLAEKPAWQTKLVQVFRARQLERTLGKRQILQLYCDHVPLHGGVRGLAAGARRWFATDARSLSPAQAATLVCRLPPATDSWRRLLSRRNRLLARLRDRGHLDRQAYLGATMTPLLVDHAATLGPSVR